MKFFTSDWHLGDPRFGLDDKLDLFYRRYCREHYGYAFDSQYEHDLFISREFLNRLECSDFIDGDEVWHLGDVFYEFIPNAKQKFANDWVFHEFRRLYPNSKLNLIIGNYDEDKLDILEKYFDNICDEHSLFIDDHNYYLNHYPIKCKEKLDVDKWLIVPCYDFAITGHIHGLWKVQPNMVNVGIDAWHFKPVSETEIDFCMNACKKFYDKNVFPYAT